MNKSIFNIKKIQAEAGSTAEVEIFGTIGECWWDDSQSNTAKKLSEKLRELSALEADKVVVKINSLGGDVDQALAIYNALHAFGDKVTVEMSGMCASAATVIAMAGKERKMSKYGLFLVHQCLCSVYGNENDMQEGLEDMKKVNATIANLYADTTGMSLKEVEALMNEAHGNGIWLNYDEAKGKGFVTGCTGDDKKNNLFSRGDIMAAKLPMVPEGYEPEERVTLSAVTAAVAGAVERFFNKKNKEMKNVITTYAALALLFESLMADDKGNVTLGAEALKKIDDSLADAAAKLEAAAKKEAEQAAKLAENEKTIAELRAVVEAKPQDSKPVNGNDSKEGESFDSWYPQTEAYKEALEKMNA